VEICGTKIKIQIRAEEEMNHYYFVSGQIKIVHKFLRGHKITADFFSVGLLTDRNR
jgi:hypothetical protein